MLAGYASVWDPNLHKEQLQVVLLQPRKTLER